MKLVLGAMVSVWLYCGCVAGDTVSHEDDPGAVKRDGGPDLCRDGTAPPCTPRS
jgi:hypothetical protein